MPDSVFTEEARGSVRGRLLRAALDVSALHRYQGLSVARVIERAGNARSTFYEHFPDRDGCFLAAVELCRRALVERIAAATADTEPAAAPAAAVKAMFEFTTEDQAAAIALFLESLAGGTASRDLRDGCADQIVELLTHRGDPKASEAWLPGVAPRFVVGGIFRLMALRLRHGGAVGLDGGLPDALTTWIGSYGLRGLRPNDRILDPAFGPSRSAPREPAPRPAVLPRGRHRLTAAEVARFQRERILDAVAQLSYAKGYAAVTVADINATARVARNVFYAQFRSRSDAATESDEVFFQQVMAASAGAFFAEPEWPDRVWAAGLALRGALGSAPANAHLGFVEPHAIGPSATQHAYERLLAFTLFLEEGYGLRPGNRALPRVVSEFLAAVMFELAYRELRATGAISQSPELLAELVYTILAPFLGVEEADAFVAAKVAERD